MHKFRLAESEKKNYQLISAFCSQGFDVQEGVSLWATYTINFLNKKNDSIEHHWIEDPRLEAEHVGSCQRLRSIKKQKEVYYTHLYPKGWY